MEGEHDDSSVRSPPPKCDSDCKDKPPTRFKSQLEAYKLTQTACDLCLDGVHYSRQYCQTCRATYCSSHLEQHSKAPATRTHKVFTYAQAAAGWGSTVSWSQALIILVAVMIPVLYVFSGDDEDARVKAFVRDQRAEANRRMQGCEELYQAVEKQRLLLVQRVCQSEEMFRNRRHMLKSRIQEDHKQLRKVLGEAEETHVIRVTVLPLIESQYSMLYAMLENHTSSAGVQKWCDEWASKSNAAQSI